jgi:histidinol-phosphatase
LEYESADSSAQPGFAEDLRLALELADAADVITMADFRGVPLPFQSKNDGTPVTETDRKVELVLRDLLREMRPLDGFLGEETGGDEVADDRRWIIDPIDGTRSFVAGDRIWGTQIALEQDHRVRLGVTSAPALRTRWWGSEGGGAWSQPAGGMPRNIRVSDRQAGKIRWTCHPPLPVLNGDWLALALKLEAIGSYAAPSVHGVLDVAAGDMEVCLQLEGQPWDYGGFVGVVMGAGGRFGYLDGEQMLGLSRPALFTNRWVHEDALLALGV